MLTRRTAPRLRRPGRRWPPLPALAQGRKDSVTLRWCWSRRGSIPRPARPHRSPRSRSSCNLYETLTKIRPDGSVTPCWPRAGEVSPDLRNTPSACARDEAFSKRRAVQRPAVGSPSTAAGDKSTNKDKAPVRRPVHPGGGRARHGAASREIGQTCCSCWARAPSSSSPKRRQAPPSPWAPAPTNWPTGAAAPARFHAWRGGARPRRSRCAAPFRFIPDPAAQVAALLAGDVDAFPARHAAAPWRRSRPTRAFSSSSAARAPRPSWPSTTRKL